ncbi:MAG TPA: M20/M25/M40 family metallo-hydrolase [Kineosporiaceae bacterium]|jgi:acetylornithine deacetylase|nr:M20/M25/M40 family metallo-hydrolase [Kineosporiaceae bacterium]
MHDDVARAAVGLAVELVRIDSVNPALVPGAAGEAEIVAHLARRLDAQGFDVEVVQAARRPSLLARRPGTGHGRAVLLNGHVDTVGVEGMPEPFAGRVDGDRLLGRGACDMKGGVAGLVAAAEAVAARGVAGDVLLALVADEEHGSLGTDAVLAHLGGRLPDACIVGEPTGLDLAAAHRGYALVDVTLTGRAAHSSQPELGVNAVTHLGRLLAAVEARGAELAGARTHPLLGSGSLQATTASGGSSAFVVPESAHALVERRTLPGERAADALGEVERILTGLRERDPSVHAVAVLGLAREAWQHDPSSPAGGRLTRELTAALEAHGHTPDSVGLPYWMESALWQGAGVPTIVCGPGGGGLHAADEWVDLDQVRRYASALVDTLTAFCA